MQVSQLTASQRNHVARSVVDMLQASESLRPRFNTTSREMQRAVSWDGLQRTMKRNRVSGAEKGSYEQAYRTLVSQQLGRQLGQLDTHAEREQLIKTGFISVNASAWRKLEQKLAGFMRADRPGKAATEMATSAEKIMGRDMGSVQGEKGRAAVANRVLDIMFNYAKVAQHGRVSEGDIRAYFKSAKGKKEGMLVKSAAFATFDYLKMAMSHPGSGVARDSVCIDERQAAFDKIMRLKEGGNTMRAIDRAASVLDKRATRA